MVDPKLLKKMRGVLGSDWRGYIYRVENLLIGTDGVVLGCFFLPDRVEGVQVFDRDGAPVEVCPPVDLADWVQKHLARPVAYARVPAKALRAALKPIGRGTVYVEVNQGVVSLHTQDGHRATVLGGGEGVMRAWLDSGFLRRAARFWVGKEVLIQLPYDARRGGRLHFGRGRWPLSLPRPV